MQLPGTQAQQARHFLYDASGTIASGGTTQLLLAESKSRSFLFIQNISDTAMYVNIGAGFAHATLTSGVVTSVTVDNAGFGFTYPPAVTFLGGGPYKPDGRTPNLTSVGVNQPGYDAPDHVAKAHAVLTTGAISSIVVEDGGVGYLAAPYVLITNSHRDGAGAALASATAGILLPVSGGSLLFNYTSCPTEPVSIFCATTGKAFICKWMP
jgi:hypothetical protein